MIKIVKNNYRKPVYEFTCPKCKSILQVEDMDLEPFGCWYKDRTYSFICPACSYYVQVQGDHMEQKYVDEEE